MKEYQRFYTATAEPGLIDVPTLAFLAVDGTGDPDDSEFVSAVEALYAVSYAVRFALQRSGGPEYSVPPSEALWPKTNGERSTWQWRVMIMQPPQATPDLVAEAIDDTAKKKPSAALAKLRLENYTEGLSAQILHVGPYRDEKATIDRLIAYIRENGYRIGGLHHEIYLSDPRRTAPEKLETIIRYPVARAS